MGNCLMQQSSSKYSTQDWDINATEGGFVVSNKEGGSSTTGVKINMTKNELKELLSKMDVREDIDAAEGGSNSKEVKIKITNKQLKELLSKIHGSELNLEQLHSHFINHTTTHALPTIPEID
ncbi:hypothetical protein VNO77_43010 [Canavalia gladiata]|uniref:Uncharacterized protein n=1 Tax=Canavalia gladiata TaxID=3824 RepID=A0AAN9JTF6_CANGL